MKLLSKVRQVTDANFSVLIIPGTRKSTKQYKLNAFATIGVLTAFVILNIIVSTFSVYYYNKSRAQTSEIIYLNSEKTSTVNSDRANFEQKNIQEATYMQGVNNTQDIADYLIERVDMLNALIIESSNVITAFNTENNTDISLPVTRSLDRTGIRAITEFKNMDDENAGLDLEAIKEQDDLSEILITMKNESSTLISEIEDELKFLDCLPDLPPIEGSLSSAFGYRQHPITGLRSFHKGLDITADRGAPVQAAGSGLVVFSGWRGGFGKVLIISHGYGYETVYAHNDDLYVEAGATVNKGDIISAVGSTGNSTGPHLHFEIRVNGEVINPTGVLRYDR